MHAFSGFWGRGRGCAGRHARRRGFAGLFGAMGGEGLGWHGLGAGRKLGAEDLQLLILALLAERPAHGYELIKAIGEQSGGFYSPSPGMVYPALTYLEEIGYASVQAEGTRKLYEITDAGRAHLAQNRRLADTILAQMKWMGARMEHLRHAFAAGEGDRPHGWSDELHDARNALRRALSGAGGEDAEEQQRIAEILARAAKEIRKS